MANDYTNAILDTIQSKLSGVAVDQIKLELFNTCDELAREALRVSPPTNTSAEPDTWLAADQWAPNYQLLLDGTLARLYAQIGKPYANPELAKAHFDRYQIYIQLARSESSSSPSTIYQRILFDLRKRIPVARDADFTAAIFTTANKIRVEALALAPLADADTTPANWLTGKWNVAYQAVFRGALAELYLQADRPWAQAEIGAATYAQFEQELALLRADASAAPATVYDRLLSTVRVQIPMIRDSAIALEAFNTADKIRREALRIAPLNEANTNPQNWFPAGKWDDCYQAMLHGTLARLFAQTERPWSNPAFAQTQYQLYVQELDLVRGEQARASSTGLITRLLDNLVVSLPGARDNIIKIELFNTLNDFFQGSNAWREDIEVAITPGVTSYELLPSGPAKIVQIMSVLDANNLPVRAQLGLISGELELFETPSSNTNFTAQVALTVADPVDREGYPVFPMWVLNLYMNGIISGVLSRMMAQPAKPYSNAQLAVFHTRAFNNTIANARIEGNRGFTYGTQKWRFPQQFNRRKTYR